MISRLLMVLVALSAAAVPASGSEGSFTIAMPGARPKGHDSYLCHGFDLNEVMPVETAFVTRFEAVNASADRVHHMLLYTCDKPASGVFDCAHHAVCRGSRSQILFAWAKNAPALELPKDVAFEVSRTSTKFLVLQMHYVNELPDPDYGGLTMHYQTEE